MIFGITESIVENASGVGWETSRNGVAHLSPVEGVL